MTHYLVVFSLDGSVVFRQNVNVDDEGPPIEFAFLESSSSPLLVS
jgi:hypothetical protein